MLPGVDTRLRRGRAAVGRAATARPASVTGRAHFPRPAGPLFYFEMTGHAQAVAHDMIQLDQGRRVFFVLSILFKFYARGRAWC